MLERDPEAAVPVTVKEDARAAGGRVERAVSVTVRPNPLPTPTVVGEVPAAPSEKGAEPAIAAACACEDVVIDLGLMRMDDGTRRVTARARGGVIVGGIDIPVDAVRMVRPKPWAVGLTVSMDMSRRRALGAFVDRDLGPLRLGLEVSQRDGGTATLRAGIRF